MVSEVVVAVEENVEKEKRLKKMRKKTTKSKTAPLVTCMGRVVAIMAVAAVVAGPDQTTNQRMYFHIPRELQLQVRV